MAKELTLQRSGAGSGTARSFWPSVAAAFSGVAASLCCIFPVVAALGGIGSASLAAAFVPYRPWLIALTVAVLGFGYYEAFFRSRPVACEDGTCRLPAAVKIQRAVIVGATVLAGVGISFPWWIRYFL